MFVSSFFFIENVFIHQKIDALMFVLPSFTARIHLHMIETELLYRIKANKHTSQVKQHTLKCLNMGTPKTINFPFVPNGKLMIFRCPNI